ncbi:MAG: glycosyltransferase family 39 protein, partial [Fimbriimonadaceae bacterium]|nr:glycosyltransferase family 39 protein [Chitinophagales bacterium]
MKNPNLPFILFNVTCILVLSISVLVQEGMFMDAVLYTDVSRNLSEGYGTFWLPQFSYHNVSGMPGFLEHPPLVFGIQSVFFKIFGDQIFTERIYVFFCLCLSIFLVLKIWKLISNSREEKNIYWLPVFLWLIMPIAFWTYQNNMHENTMVVFILCSVYFYLVSRKKKKYFYLSIAALSIFLSTFSKGLPGFFPLTLPFLYWLCFRKNNFMQMITEIIFITAIPVAIYLILFNLPASKESLNHYLFDRVLHRIDADPTVKSRFYILGAIAMQVMIPVVIVSSVVMIAKKKNAFHLQNEKLRSSIFFILIGLCGSLPIMLTLVQKTFYFTPSLPFLGIGFALLINQPVSKFIYQ